MTVYWEYAFLGNLLPDVVLLYLSIRCARLRVRAWRLLLGGGAGAVFAVVYPRLGLAEGAGVAVKLCVGAAFVLIAADAGGAKEYAAAILAFYALTFALGGLMTALYADARTASDGSIRIRRIPPLLLLGLIGAFAAAVNVAARAFWRYRAVRRNVLYCVLLCGGRQVRWRGFADSGNCLSYLGRPVCVISAAGAFALLGAAPRAVGRMTVGTVNGSRISPVFRCDALCVAHKRYENVFLTVGDTGKFPLILHTALTDAGKEVEHEYLHGGQGMAAKEGLGKRRPLFMRKRGASAAPLPGGGGAASLQARGGEGDGGSQGETHRT